MSGVSRADLLRLRKLGHGEAAEALGFEFRAERDAWDEEGGDAQVAEARLAEVEAEPVATPRAYPAQEPGFWTIAADWTPDRAAPVAEVGPTLAAPERPAYRPLQPFSITARWREPAIRNLADRLLAGFAPGPRIDEKDLVRRVASSRPVTSLPRLRGRRLAEPVLLLCDRAAELEAFRPEADRFVRFLADRLPPDRLVVFDLWGGVGGRLQAVDAHGVGLAEGEATTDEIADLAAGSALAIALGRFGARPEKDGEPVAGRWLRTRLGRARRMLWISPDAVGDAHRPDHVVDPRPSLGSARGRDRLLATAARRDHPHLAEIREVALALDIPLTDELAAMADPRIARVTGQHWDVGDPDDRWDLLEALETLPPEELRAIESAFARLDDCLSLARREFNELLCNLRHPEGLGVDSLQYLNRYALDLLRTDGKDAIAGFLDPRLAVLGGLVRRYPSLSQVPLIQAAQVVARRRGRDQLLEAEDPGEQGPGRPAVHLRQLGGVLHLDSGVARSALLQARDIYCRQTRRSNEGELGRSSGRLDLVLDQRRNVRLEYLHRPTWAERIWRNEEGLFAAHREGAVFQQLPSGYAALPGDLWTCRHNPWSWAVDCGVDLEGLWAAFELDGVRQVLRWIPPGTFVMGSPGDEPKRGKDEVQHEVTLTRGYWLGETTVTQGLWTRAARNNPSQFGDDPECPVETVSWEDAVAWIEGVNRRLEGLVLRLPTEAEWEYACRAGTTTPFHFGSTLSTDRANYDGNHPYAGGAEGEYRQRTMPVRSFEPNDWGLYQMHGNVDEWCADWFGAYPDGPVSDPEGPEGPEGPEVGRRRVLRGGSWIDDGRDLRSAQRRGSVPGSRLRDIGFRLAGGPPSQDPGAGPGHSADRWPEADRASDGHGDGTGGRRSWWSRLTGRGNGA